MMMEPKLLMMKRSIWGALAKKPKEQEVPEANAGNDGTQTLPTQSSVQYIVHNSSNKSG
jgi:hypothetical protein